MDYLRTVIMSSCMTYLVLVAGIPALPVHAQDTHNNLVFILDGSGSMWGRVGDRMKISEAKGVMGELLAEVPPNVDVGLIAYGHRRKGDCADIETLAGIGTSPANIEAKLQNITPRGKTPITAALQRGAELLSGKGEESTVVLVSDGIETCSTDPCALAARLAEQGVKLTIHTVGFGVRDDAAAQLQCIADAGGGHYYHASDGATLRESLFAVRDAVASAAPAAPPPEALSLPKVKTKNISLKIPGPGTIVIDPAPWVQMPFHEWLLLDAETGSKLNSSNQGRLRAKPGEYQVAWKQEQWVGVPIPLTEVVSLSAAETVTVPVDTGLRITIPDGMKPPHRWALRPLDQDLEAEINERAIGFKRGDAAFFSSLGPHVVPAGTYRLLWHETEYQSNILDLGTIDIVPRQLNQLVLDGGFVLQGSNWLTGEPFVYTLVDSNGGIHGSWKGWGAHLAPAGEYELHYKHTQWAHDVINWGPVTINENGVTAVAVDSGVRFVPQGDAPVPYRIAFVDLDSGAEIGWKISDFGRWDAIPLPPGRYRIDWQEQQFGSPVTVLEMLEIPTGTLVEIGI